MSKSHYWVDARWLASCLVFHCTRNFTDFGHVQEAGHSNFMPVFLSIYRVFWTLWIRVNESRVQLKLSTNTPENPVNIQLVLQEGELDGDSFVQESFVASLWMTWEKSKNYLWIWICFLATFKKKKKTLIEGILLLIEIWAAWDFPIINGCVCRVAISTNILVFQIIYFCHWSNSRIKQKLSY